MVYGIAAKKHARLMVTRGEVRNLPEVTSRLISKLYRLYASCASVHSAIRQIEIRRDVTSGRLLASLRVTLKRANFTAVLYTTPAIYGTHLEYAMTSRTIWKLDRV